MTGTTKTEEFAQDAAIEAQSADRDLLTAVAKMRRDLDDLVAAVENQHRVASGVSGRSFAQQTAADLVDAINTRRERYDRLSLVLSIVDSVDVEV